MAVATQGGWSQSVRLNAVDRDQGQAQVADLCEHPMQGSLVSDRPGDDRLAKLAVAGHLQPINQADQPAFSTPATLIS